MVGGAAALKYSSLTSGQVHLKWVADAGGFGCQSWRADHAALNGSAD
jgi:hypothetical protein